MEAGQCMPLGLKWGLPTTKRDHSSTVLPPKRTALARDPRHASNTQVVEVVCQVLGDTANPEHGFPELPE